ncbi:MAG: hypothetical protein NTV75_10420 [Bacteroidia bacterium]|nr:hypothetical protein [Bacteroidia bacterium]
MRRSFRLSILFFFGTILLIAIQVQCRHDGLNVATLKPVCFDTEIAPIFVNNCASCHNRSHMEAGYSYADYNSIMKSITPFESQNSKAYQAITGKGFKQLMPPNSALSENDRILIRVWIDQGAKYTICTTPPNTGGNTGGTTGGGPIGLKSDAVCFQRDILPILLSSCGTTGCHNQTSAKEGYVTVSYASVMANMVKAGAPNSSKLYTEVANNKMPPSNYAKLTQASKDSIFNWIKNGALNETCTSNCDTITAVTYSNQISALISRNCISCHSGSSAQKGILLDSYASVKIYLDNGRLLSSVKGTTIQMPPGYKISSCELRQLELWKANGAKQN